MDGLETALGAVLSWIADGSLGAAGAQLWESLRERIAKVRGSERELQLPELGAGASDEDVSTAAALLARAAEDNEQLHGTVTEWLGDARVAIETSSVSNVVAGEISGNAKVVQAGKIRDLKID